MGMGVVGQRLVNLGTAIAVTLVMTVALAPAARAAAAGCDAAHPTRIAGTIHGYPDNRALDALIGVDAVDAAGNHIDRDGLRRDQGGHFCGGYGWCFTVNPTLGAEGSDDPAATRTWGDGAGGCASSLVTEVFIEVYPKNAGGHTDFARYGEAAHYYQPITAGGDNQVGLRLPLRDELGGNTGYVNGYITLNGGAVPDPASNLVIRAFTLGRGPECGVEGFAASAEVLGTSSSGVATYYRTPPLAGGRCGAATQSYSLQVTCRCTGVRQTRNIDIADGRGIRVDFGF